MNISEKAICYFIDEPLAKTLVLLLNEENDVIFSKLADDAQSYVRQVGVAQLKGGSKVIYSGEDADKAYDILKQLETLGVLTSCFTGFCSGPRYYALAGDWKRRQDDPSESEIRPNQKDRKYLHELLQ